MFPLSQHSAEWWVAVVTLIGVAWQFGLVPLSRIIARAVRLAPVLSSADTAFARIEAGIAEIKKEVKTNGGSSIKDAVKRIEERAVGLEAQTKAQTEILTAQIRGVKATSLLAQRAANRAEKVATQALTVVSARGN